jgi:hypothetical protein
VAFVDADRGVADAAAALDGARALVDRAALALAHDDLAADFGPAQRPPVDVVRHRHADHVRDRRHDRHRLDVAVVDAALRLPRVLHEQRHHRDVRQVPRRHRPAVVAGDERHAVVGGDDDEGAVPQALALQLRDQAPEQPVGETDLEQVSLPPLLDHPRIVRPRVALESVDAERVAVLLP